MNLKIFAFLLFAWPLSLSAAVVKSPLDARQYRAITLDNGLQVLLVSDPSTDQAAASLDVRVGNGSDPEGWQGLAHFLEHMLFLGNAKYPEAGEYARFISDHGGDSNAYTSFAHTNYYFNVGAAHLLPALDRFAQFFISPTFDETFVGRERAVVHSEYQARLKDENRRLASARRQLINAEHPLSRFVVGSEYTLRDRDHITVRQKLIEFYRRHYSSNLMTLAVVGKEPLVQLEHWVERLFSAIPNHHTEAAVFRQPYIERERLASRLNVRPQQDQMRASFVFPIASTEAYYRSKPLSYIANLLGHEGEGSLLALLESLGWAEGLGAGGGYMDEVQGAFEVSIQLTETGLRHLDEIGALLFQTIDLIRREGVEAWRYDEGRRLAEIAFRFAEMEHASVAARWLAASLHRYPNSDVLRGPYIMDDYRPELIRDLLASLTPDNVVLQVLAKGVEVNARTPFYDAEYGIQPIAPATLEYWRGQTGDANRDERLALPLPNRFIPERLDAQDFAEATTIPQRLNINANTNINAWYRADAQFATPRAVFYISIRSPVVGDSARNLVLTTLFVRMVNKRLARLSYAAQLAGLDYQLYRHSRGISIRISGYEDKQPELLEAVLAALFERDFEAGKMALIVDKLKRKWRNAELEIPSGQGVREMYRLLLHPTWGEAERLAVIDNITVDDLNAHARRLLHETAISIVTLAHGDTTQARALRMNALLAAAFAESDTTGEVARIAVRMLDDDTAYLRSLDVDHNDSSLLVYFQGRDQSDAERANMALLGQLIDAPFFFNLRTQNRVGYLVQSSGLEILEAPGLLFSVQSPTHTPLQINRLMEDFLGQFASLLAAMNEDDLAQAKQGLIDRLLRRDQKLSERSNRYWDEIDRENFSFDSRRRIAEALKGLNKEDVREYFQQVIEDNPRKLIVQSPGRRPQAADGLLGGAGDANEYTRVPNAIEFRKSAGQFFRSIDDKSG